MDKIPAGQALPIRAPQRAAPPAPRPLEYNAGLDQFVSTSSLEDIAQGKSLVRRFVYGIADLCSPAPKAPRPR